MATSSSGAPLTAVVPKEVAEAIDQAMVRRLDTTKALVDAMTASSKDDDWTYPVQKRLTKKDRRDAQRLLRRLMNRHKWHSVTVNLIEIQVGGAMKLGCTTIDGTPMNYFLEIKKGTDLNGLSHDRFTKDAIKVRLSKGDSVDESPGLEMVTYLNDAFIIVMKEGKEVPFRLHDGDLYDADGNKVSTDDSVKILGDEKHLVRTFNLTPSQSDTTAGDRKKWQFTILADQKDIPLVKSVLSMGMSDLLVTDNDKGAIAKASTRLTQLMAGSCNGGQLLCYALYFGKMRFADGEGYVTSDFIARVLSFLSGGKYVVDPAAVEGLAVQSRPIGAKSLQFTVGRDLLLQFVDEILKDEDKSEPIVLVRDEIGAEELANLWLAFQKQGPWYGKLVVVAENRFMAKNWRQFVELLLDMNANKAITDIGLPAYFPILDISHEAHDREHGAKLSTQFISKLVADDREAAMKLVVASAHRFFLETVENWSKEAKETVSFEEMQDSRSILNKVAPTAREFIRPLFDSEISGILKTFSSLCGQGNKVKLTTHGEYRKGISDPMVELCGIRVLSMADGVAKVIVPGSEDYDFDGNGARGILQRYPSPGYNECAKIQSVTVDWYMSEARQLGCSEVNIVKAVARLLRRLNEGCIVLPASARLTSALGGADFDGDGYIVYWTGVHSTDFTQMSIDDILSIDSVEKMNEILLQGIQYFYERIIPVCNMVPEF